MKNPKRFETFKNKNPYTETIDRRKILWKKLKLFNNMCLVSTKAQWRVSRHHVEFHITILQHYEEKIIFYTICIVRQKVAVIRFLALSRI